MCRFKEFYLPKNAAVTAKEEVKIDAVVGAAAMARTNAERVQRERKGQPITGARISEEGINYGLLCIVTAPKLPPLTSFLFCSFPASAAYHPFPLPVCSTYGCLARITQIIQ